MELERISQPADNPFSSLPNRLPLRIPPRPPQPPARPAEERESDPMNPTQRACAVALLLTFGTAHAGEQPADVRHFEEQVRPFLVRHCRECHAGQKPKGGFRLDDLTADFNADAGGRWLAAEKRLRSGEMPPKSKPRPPEKETLAVADWIAGKAAARRAAEGRVVLRRLNRVEYENTVRDLLGVDVRLKDQLPADGSAEGFDNVGKALHVSSFLMERYLETADVALNQTVANRPKPPSTTKRYSLNDTHQIKRTTESVYRKIGDTVVCFSSSAWNAAWLSPFYPQERGRYRFRISASGFQSNGKPVTYGVTVNGTRLAGKSGLIGYFDAPADKPTVVEFVEVMEPRATISILPYGLAGANTINKIGADKYEGPGLAVQWVEVEGPLNDTWPPAGHRLIFGDLPQGPSPIYNARDRVEVVSKEPEADAERILRKFVRRAFRRSVTDDDVEPFLALVKARLAEKHSFEKAVRVGLLAVMVSPEFLFLREKPGPLDDFALASRLSYFLWSTMPDEELLTLAEKGKLRNPDTLRQQVERLLKHPKSAAFTESFTGQWLGLRDIDFTEPSHILYPEFDHMLKVSMIRETELFFREVLEHDLGLTNFVASDFTMLNGRLAKHYGIPNVEGFSFRKVTLPPDSHRGGVLTMASVLKVTANGTTTSPVTRGAWVLDRILGTPPSPPPEGVAGLEPDIRGATTIREQLAKHRQIASCAACHAMIDPPGFALESFDVIGGWRDNYRTSGSGEVVIVDGRRMSYHKGKKVDPSDVMPDGQRFRNIDELKQLLLKDRDQLARSLTAKLLTYATGGVPETADRPEIDAIVLKIRERQYGLRALVHEIVQSKAFQHK
jgi:mono/diheme cytochrome c family protein